MGKFSFSLNKLISNLLTVTDNEEFSVSPDEEVRATTVRLEPEVKKFCEVQAEKLGISAQAFISMVLKGVMLETVSPVKSELTLIQERFFELFKIHEIPLTDIPNLLEPFNITLSTIADNGRLLDAYSSRLVDFLSSTFFVSKEWINGKNHSAPYHTGWSSWYKGVRDFCNNLIKMLENEESPKLFIIKDENYDLDLIDKMHNSRHHPSDKVKIVVQGTNKYSPGKSFNFHRQYKAEPWAYYNCRIQLKAIILFCHLMQIPIEGYSISQPLFKEINWGNNLFIKHKHMFTQISWNPDDYIDALERKDGYPTSRPQGEIGYVFNEFLSQGLHQILFDTMENNLFIKNRVNSSYLMKIVNLQDSDEKYHPISYEKIKEVHGLIAKSLAVKGDETQDSEASTV